LAYTTHSPYNDPGVPYAWSNWSWGYGGVNPVQWALRRVVVVHGDGLPTYLLVQDDIQKDGNVHRYDWCAHFPDVATVDTSNPAGPIAVAVGGARLELHALYPRRQEFAGVQVWNFNNQSEDPDSKMLMLSTNAVNPNFTLLLVPRSAGDPAPVVSTSTFADGTITVVAAPGGPVDVVFVRNTNTGPVAVTPSSGVLPADENCGTLVIDARLAVVRLGSEGVVRYLAVDGKSIACGVDIVTIADSTATFAFDGTRAHIDRPDSGFRILADGVSEVVSDGEVVATALDGNYLVRVSSTSVTPSGPGAGLRLRAFPNPFNPSVRVSFTTATRGRVDADIFDAAGRFVVRMAGDIRPAGEHAMEWNGRDRAGRPAASGVYFLRVRTASAHETLKLVLLR
jgi:hypothetical protein